MAKKKGYYGVKVGKTPGIYLTWNECEEQVKGVSGAKYKSFNTLEEAERYLDERGEDVCQKGDEIELSVIEINNRIDHEISLLTSDEVIAFVDGSYNRKSEKSGFGAIIITSGGNKEQLYRSFTKDLGEDFISLGNVAAELEGVIEVVNWAISSKKQKVTIYYDYIGIEEWAKGNWKANKELTKKYVSFMEEKSKLIHIEFCKVKSHIGITLNEEADKLASFSLLAKGHKTYNDGSVYFVGYSSDDWAAIVDYINTENDNLCETEIENITLAINTISESRKKLIITNNLYKVTINCYNNTKSYVQGKQTSLLQKLIATAIELMTNGETVVETLNAFHALNIEKHEVEIHFDRLIPNYTGNNNDKLYSNLLSAVYNTMLNGYMPDYTCLVMPLFRGYEHYLHEILGKKLGLQTSDSEGRNNFGYFDKVSNNKYICNNKNIKVLNQDQIGYLNELYTKYNKVRHPYAHWSFDNYDSSMIAEMKEAREILVNGLKFINNYYKIF